MSRWLTSVVAKIKKLGNKSSAARPRPRVRLGIESLEQRLVLSKSSLIWSGDSSPTPPPPPVSGGTVTQQPPAQTTPSKTNNSQLFAGGGDPTPPAGSGTTTTSGLAAFFSPYDSVEAQPRWFDYTTAAQNGIKNITLGFVTADAANKPSWDGDDEVNTLAFDQQNGLTFDAQLHQQVNNFRALGGDVMLSFGGWVGDESHTKELARAISDPALLKQAYQQAISAYSATTVDFDLEGQTITSSMDDYDPAAFHTTSIDTRSAVIASLQQDAANAGKPLHVWLTLTTTPSGLLPDSLYVLKSALDHGVKLDGVNLMTMDYTDGVNYDGLNGHLTMGGAAVSAATAVVGQLQTQLTQHNLTETPAQIWHMIGITPQIGVNIQTSAQAKAGVENFTQADAQAVVNFAQKMGVGRLSMWSLNKDRQVSGEGAEAIYEDASGLPQQPFAYSKIFEQIANSPVVNQPTNTVTATVSFQDSNDWVTGFTGYLTITNTSSTAINGWTLEFDFTSTIGSTVNVDIWNAQMVSHVGTHYVIQNAAWDATIAPGQSVSFGFNAAWATPQLDPSNYVLNGVGIPGV